MPSSTTSSTCPADGDYHFCTLTVLAPSSVVEGTSFTVTVNVTTDGVTLASSDKCASKLPVSLLIQLDNQDAPIRVTSFLSGWEGTKNASGAVASFSVPGLAAGDYSIRAYWAGDGYDACFNYYSDGYAYLTAITIPPNQSIAPCPPYTVCTQTTSGTGSAATLIAEDGMFYDVYWDTTTGAEVEATGGCTVPVDTSGGVLNYLSSSTYTKTIVFALAPYLVKRGIGSYNICWSAPYDAPFTTKSKTPAVLQSNGFYTGTLPDCKAGDLGPCITFRKSNKKNAVFIGMIAPPVLDPKGYVN